MVILVTGGAGYIGSHTCVELLQAGHEIIILDNFSNSSPQAIRNVKKITGKEIRTYKADLLNKSSIEQVFAENQIDVVIHFAGLKAVGESVSVPLDYYQNNITGTIHLCKLMQEFGVKKMVFSSSATVYGNQNQVPISEETTLTATNPYGRTKLMIEEMLQDLAAADSDWSIAILRYFNPIGAHPSGEIGEHPNGIPNNLMPYIAQVAIGKMERLQIFGKDYKTRDGTGIRDYIHVIDLAIGHLHALEWTNTSHGVEAFNLGTGKGYSVLEVIAAFEHASGRKIPYIYTAPRLGDIAICYANPAKARTNLNWQAKRDIKQMCRDTWRWQHRYPNGYEKETEDVSELFVAGGN